MKNKGIYTSLFHNLSLNLLLFVARSQCKKISDDAFHKVQDTWTNGVEQATGHASSLTCPQIEESSKPLSALKAVSLRENHALSVLPSARSIALANADYQL